MFKLPTGQAVPRVTETYRLLGHEVNAHVGNEVARDSLVYRASLGARVISQLAGGTDLPKATALADGLIVGLTAHYAGPTPTGWDASEAIECERRKALGRQGHRAISGQRV